jgi:hypothetical protein
MTPPEGHRLLEIGEIICEGDWFLSTSGIWVPAPVTGVPVIDNGVIWSRQVFFPEEEKYYVIENGENLALVGGTNPFTKRDAISLACGCGEIKVGPEDELTVKEIKTPITLREYRDKLRRRINVLRKKDQNNANQA